MNKYNIIKKVICCNQCTFSTYSMDGSYCAHPYWKDKNFYESLSCCEMNIDIIPEKCPLKPYPVNIQTIT